MLTRQVMVYWHSLVSIVIRHAFTFLKLCFYVVHKSTATFYIVKSTSESTFYVEPSWEMDHDKLTDLGATRAMAI